MDIYQKQGAVRLGRPGATQLQLHLDLSSEQFTRFHPLTGALTHSSGGAVALTSSPRDLLGLHVGVPRQQHQQEQQQGQRPGAPGRWGSARAPPGAHVCVQAAAAQYGFITRATPYGFTVSEVVERTEWAAPEALARPSGPAGGYVGRERQAEGEASGSRQGGGGMAAGDCDEVDEARAKGQVPHFVPAGALCGLIYRYVIVD